MYYDLIFERRSRLTPQQIWQGWTEPSTLKQWFCPRPWKVNDCRIDLNWTNCLLKDFLPNPELHLGFPFVVDLTLLPDGDGTLYRATVHHANAAGRDQHQGMGFQDGWGIAFQQLEELFK